MEYKEIVEELKDKTLDTVIEEKLGLKDGEAISQLKVATLASDTEGIVKMLVDNGYSKTKAQMIAANLIDMVGADSFTAKDIENYFSKM